MTAPPTPPSNPLIDSLRRAVDAAPDDVTLRLHLAELFLQVGQRDEAVLQCANALQREPTNQAARELMGRAMGGDVRSAGGPDTQASPAAPSTPPTPTPPAPEAPPVPAGPTAQDAPPPSEGEQPTHTDGFDWHEAESDVSDIAPEPMFVDEGGAPEPSASAWDVESSTITLADVGGMAQVKDRLNAAFLAPMRNPELRKLYGKSLRGGMLLYGPPGCGKTFIGRAVAGEMGAHFVNVGLADVLDMYIGNSERNIQSVFRLARENAPCVLFLDEVDAIGQKRSMTRNSGMRTAVNQLLTEPHYRSTAEKLGEMIRSEDGTGQALRMLERIH